MTPELSRPIRIDTLGAGPRKLDLVADEGERAALVRRLRLLALDRLAATAELTREGEAVIAVGRIEALVAQACVASGAPVAQTIDEPFALRFVPERPDALPEEMELGATDLDELGYSGGSVDLGEAVAQTLALALDPFPRAPDADAALRAAGVVGEDEAGPFGALKGLKDLMRGA